MRAPAALLLCFVRLQAAASSDCAPCHRAIYDSYRRTPMAATSGLVTSLNAGSGAIAGFRYRISRNSIEFSNESIRLTRQLPYFVGSGAAARSYLLEDQGFLYEAPVAWYTVRRQWDLAPAYDRYQYPFLTRPIPPACLTCHASFLSPVPGTQNRFAAPPFAEGGVACERCHGSGESHIALQQSGSIVNPARLDAARRDSICSQCHLSGEVRVMRPGADWRSFRPGDRLSDSLTVFIEAGGNPGMTVTGHVEKLALSACKRAAQDRLWCGSCHDPHALPSAAGRAAWFREKCLTCHAGAPCKETLTARARKQDDCTACHMPRNPVVDAQHVIYTDHSIPRRPRPPGKPAPKTAELVPFAGPASDRDLAMAYAIAASRANGSPYQPRALALLQKAERESPNDAEVLLYLAGLYRNGGRPEQAIPLYRRAMALDPAQVTASVGLGGILMERGEYAGAIPLWEDALSKNSGLVLVRTNLALAYWRSGNAAAAEAHLVKAVAMSPGFAVPADLLKKLRQ